MIKNTLQKIYLGLIFILLYAPIITLVVLSFNNSKTRAKWGGFTGKWYVALFQNEQIMNALYTTLIIALLSALIATLIGTAAAIGIQAMRKRVRTAMMAVTNIPMLNADIVTGISLMLLFIAFRFSLGFATILMAHITFNIPYVILSVMPKLKQTNRRTYEAALDLGASPIYAFFKVVFPDILPGVFSGFLLAFTMSLDDFVITHFTKGPGVDTLSTKIYSEVRKGIKPEMYVYFRPLNSKHAFMNSQGSNKWKHPLPAYSTELSAGIDIRANLADSRQCFSFFQRRQHQKICQQKK